MIRVRRSAVIDAPIERVWEVLRDFNSHSAWHPAVGPSEIENGEPPDQVGCVRNFFLKDGNHIREQLLALSDRDHISTYCILDATLPMRKYVATVELKRVTDGEFARTQAKPAPGPAKCRSPITACCFSTSCRSSIGRSSIRFDNRSRPEASA